MVQQKSRQESLADEEKKESNKKKIEINFVQCKASCIIDFCVVSKIGG